MFTGIVEAALNVEAARASATGLRLSVRVPESWKGEVRLGDSIAVNGCCLTISELKGMLASFDVVPETLRLTSLVGLKTGSLVNIERALKFGERIDGHMVQGHVDGIGTIEAIDLSGGERRLRIATSAEFCAQCIHKGSVCVDGISLTIAALEKKSFTVAIVPHTWEVTNLRERKVGDAVNLEADMLGKYVRKSLENRDSRE
ncbi:MAG: riboflavin synthase [Planctomycetes bacterium]|nr:riboflavin synthase [Planctomycetota bacterium]NUQ33586.1 riboflavin synthase [Planctomycetaceae bacterium]